MSEEVRPGTLYIVSIPIGNLEDITYRAVKILAGVDLIAAEDTRKTRVLLDHYDIRKPLLSYFSYNETRRIPELLEKLKGGKAIGLVSDAGTPGISDPAYRVIRAALDAALNVVAIPGPSAFLLALIGSGLPIDSFVFEGFLPVKKGRATMLGLLRVEQRTMVLYESPHRLNRTLGDLLRVLGDRRIAVSRELTKKFEETIRGTMTALIDHFSKHPARGEFVLVIEGARDRKPESDRSSSQDMPT